MILLRFWSRTRKSFRHLAMLAIGLVGLVMSQQSLAEVIHIPVGEQAPELRDLPRPLRGMSQDTVLTEFGEPLSLSAPVGVPPISKWVYENFTVYFESSSVIHSVLTHRPKHPQQ